LNPFPAGQKPYRLIDSPAALTDCLRDLNAQPSIAFDLEFDSHRHSYGVTLCLVQVATPSICYLIDPFAPLDLDGLYLLFENEGVEKIMHSPGEDLRLLHGLQCFPKNLFDTEVVARLLNYEQTSLAAMLQAKLGHTMNKQQQRSNWLRRPLSREQQQYAADDVGFLHALKAVLVAEAAQRELMAFVMEEQSALSTTIHRQEARSFFLKPADLRTLSPYDQHVLNALFVYRDELARKLNKPAFQVLDESVVRALAAGTLLPRELPNSRGVYGGFKNAAFAERLSRSLATILAEANDLGLAKTPPPRQRLSPDERSARGRAKRDQEEKFAPIQQALAGRFGANAARYMLSNSLVNDLLKRSVTIKGLKHAYRRKLIRDIAAELGIDLSSYE
jgi:ribonuclease D